MCQVSKLRGCLPTVKSVLQRIVTVLSMDAGTPLTSHSYNSGESYIFQTLYVGES